MKPTIVAHNARFHSDDVFAVATLLELLGDATVVRTREPELVEKGDYVVDVGNVYDPALNRFDHHQIGGAGKRNNGIPYASFGLVWKTYGEKLAGSKVVADMVDKHLVQPIDAMDNGIDLYTAKIPDVQPFIFQDITGLFNPTWKEDDSNIDETFLRLVSFARTVIQREIKHATDNAAMTSVLEKAYAEAPDKRIIVLDEPMPWDNLEIINSHPEPLYVVRPNRQDPNWKVEAVRTSLFTFECRKYMPEAWGGKRHEELAMVTGIPDSVFCHNNRFLAVAKTKESALQLAQMAANA